MDHSAKLKIFRILLFSQICIRKIHIIRCLEIVNKKKIEKNNKRERKLGKRIEMYRESRKALPNLAIIEPN